MMPTRRSLKLSGHGDSASGKLGHQILQLLDRERVRNCQYGRHLSRVQYFNISPLGSLIGLVWATFNGFMGGALLPWLCNYFAQCGGYSRTEEREQHD
jgi:hypothetical protein